jgi:hypothetical protein
MTGGLLPISSSCRQAPLYPRPDIFFNWTLAVIALMQNSLWREDGFVSHKYAFPFVKCVCIAHVAHYSKFLLLHYIQIFCQSRLCKADHAYLTYLMLQRQLITWTDISFTTAKFNPLIFSVYGIALFYTVNMFILMILYDFCMLPTHFCYIIVYTRKVESCMQVADRCAPWKIFSGVENLLL